MPYFTKGSKHRAIYFDSDARYGLELGPALFYYMHLLVHRKQMAKDAIDAFIIANGREPTSDEQRKIFQKLGKERDYMIFHKGFKEISTGGQVITDEHLVAAAAVGAIVNGKPTTVLTRDQDVFDQFYKMTGFLTYQYQATVFASRFANDRKSFTTSPMPRSRAIDYFLDAPNSYLVKKPCHPDDFVRWLLPSEYELIPMSCCLISGIASGLFMQPMEYRAEADMSRLIYAKAATCGLNTDSLDGLNCHCVGYPDGIDDPRQWVIIVKDHELRDTTGVLRFPLLDVAMAAKHNETMKASSRWNVK